MGIGVVGEVIVRAQQRVVMVRNGGVVHVTVQHHLEVATDVLVQLFSMNLVMLYCVIQVCKLFLSRPINLLIIGS